MVLLGCLYLITLPFAFTNFDVSLWVGYPWVNEIYFYSCFKIYQTAGMSTEITQPTDEMEQNVDCRVSDNTKSLLKDTFFLLCSAFGKV